MSSAAVAAAEEGVETESSSSFVTTTPHQFRELCRSGKFQKPTNGICPGFGQCNLVILPQEYAYDFLLFCQRNPQACPLMEVCNVGSPHVPTEGVKFPILAPDADLRTDLPKYAIYRNGEFDCFVTDIGSYWNDTLVAFLIGCSFSCDGALLDAGIPLRSAEQGRNVPMYRTNWQCRPAGVFHGPLVVSMKPIPAHLVSRHVQVTSNYPHAHGGPICVGGDPASSSSSCLGIADLTQPDYGDPVDFQPDDVAVFHACGVTPQAVLQESKIPFAITHAPGYMLVTDWPAAQSRVE